MGVSGLLWLMFGDALAGTCAEPVSAEDLNAMIAVADSAFLASQSEAVPPIAAKINEALPCASALLNPVTVGGVYRVNAVSAFVARDREASKRWFAALRVADPGYALPAMIAEKHPMRADFQAIDLSAEASMDLAPASTGRIWVHGNPAEKRPESMPALMQWEDTEGRVGWTAMVQPGESPPEYTTGDTSEKPNGEKRGFALRFLHRGDGQEGQVELVEAIPADPDGDPVVHAPHEGPRWGFVAGGGAALLAAGGLGLWSLSEAAAYDDCAAADPVCFERWQDEWKANTKGSADLSAPERVGGVLSYGLDQTYARNHLAAELALGAGVVGAGLITVGFVW